jgi:hypothetical protein
MVWFILDVSLFFLNLNSQGFRATLLDQDDENLFGGFN